jgi:hypothetical protein
MPGTGSVDPKGVREYTRKWLVKMQNLSDTPPAAWGAGFAVVPRYSSYPTDAGAVAVSLDCNPGQEIGFYDVSIKYTSKPFDDGNQSQNPANSDQSVAPPFRPWVINFGAVHTTRLLTRDVATGAAVANSAGQPYDPPPEIPSSNLCITITAYKDLNTFDPVSKVLTYQDSINDGALLMLVSPATMTTFPIRTLRCNEYKFSSHYENGAAYWQLDLTLEYKFNGWNPIQILDAGTYYLKSMALPPQPILDLQGHEASHPMPLNGAGQPLTAGGALQYKSFSGYREVNMATILS